MCYRPPTKALLVIVFADHDNIFATDAPRDVRVDFSDSNTGFSMLGFLYSATAFTLGDVNGGLPSSILGGDFVHFSGVQLSNGDALFFGGTRSQVDAGAPEPATWLLFSSGSLVLALIAFRRRRNAPTPKTSELHPINP